MAGRHPFTAMLSPRAWVCTREAARISRRARRRSRVAARSARATAGAGEASGPPRRLGTSCSGSRVEQGPPGRPRSDAPENLRSSQPYHAAIRGNGCCDPSCYNGRRVDKAPGPDRGRSAIWCPRPRRLEDDPRASNASCQIIGNCRTYACRATDENSAEISSRVAPQNLQERTPLTLPNGGQHALGRSRGSGCDKKKKSGDDTVHVAVLPTLVAVRAWYLIIRRSQRASSRHKAATFLSNSVPRSSGKRPGS